MNSIAGRIRHGAQHARMCLGVVVTLVSAVGCAPSPDRAQYTVEQYRHDARLRKEQVRRCANDPGSLGKTAECINALRAESLEGIGSFKDLPPMKLPPPRIDTKAAPGDGNPR